MPSAVDFCASHLDLDDQIFSSIWGSPSIKDNHIRVNEGAAVRLDLGLTSPHPWDEFSLLLPDSKSHQVGTENKTRLYPFRILCHHSDCALGDDSSSPATSSTDLSVSPPCTPGTSLSASDLPLPPETSVLDDLFGDVLEPFDTTLSLSLFGEVQMEIPEPSDPTEETSKDLPTPGASSNVDSEIPTREELSAPSSPLSAISTDEGDDDDEASMSSRAGPIEALPVTHLKPTVTRTQSRVHSARSRQITRDKETQHSPEETSDQEDAFSSFSNLQRKAKRSSSPDIHLSSEIPRKRLRSAGADSARRLLTVKKTLQYKEDEQLGDDEDEYVDEESEEEFDPGYKSEKRNARAKSRKRAGLCPLGCGESFSRQHDVDRHVRTARIHNPRASSEKDIEDESQPNSKTAIICPDCGKSLSRWDAVKRHKESDACDKFIKARARERQKQLM